MSVVGLNEKEIILILKSLRKAGVTWGNRKKVYCPIGGSCSPGRDTVSYSTTYKGHTYVLTQTKRIGSESDFGLYRDFWELSVALGRSRVSMRGECDELHALFEGLEKKREQKEAGRERREVQNGQRLKKNFFKTLD